MPSLPRRMLTYLEALARWQAAGRPVVSDEAARRRLAVCTGSDGRPACPSYDAAATTCRECGCPFQARGLLALVWAVAGNPPRNFMATEDCPLGKWPPLEPAGPAVAGE